MNMQKKQVWIARWKICSTVFMRYWKTLTDNLLDAIGLSCLLTCILTSYLGMVGVDRGYMAGFFVAWTGLILWVTADGTSSTPASPRNQSDQKNQDSELFLGLAICCFVVSGIESCLGMVTGSATHMSICWFSWLGFLISLSLHYLLTAGRVPKELICFNEEAE
jgi:hypothetical protein